eukprot:scaffold120048_cov60-Attheya_sp.AAC.1
MERIFQITTNYALVQAGFFDVIIKDVFIDEQCLIENNMCITATDTDHRMLPYQEIAGNTVTLPGRKLKTEEPKVPEGMQFSDERYTNFCEETVGEEYAKKLMMQKDLLADLNFLSYVATLCRLYGNFLNE